MACCAARWTPARPRRRSPSCAGAPGAGPRRAVPPADRLRRQRQHLPDAGMDGRGPKGLVMVCPRPVAALPDAAAEAAGTAGGMVPGAVDTWMRQRLDGAGPRDLRRRLAERFWRGGRCPAAIRWSPSTAPGAIPPTVSAAAAAGAGADPQGGRLDEKRLRAERGGTARRGPAPEAPAHEGDRRRGRAGVQRAAQQAIKERDPPFMPGGGPATTDRCRLVRGQRTRTDMGEARQGNRHGAPLRVGPRPAAHRREPPPESQHARMRGDRRERRHAEVPVGHRPPAWTGHGDVRHAVRPPQAGHRERDVPDTGARDPYRSGNGSGHGHSHPADVLATPAMPAFLTARARRRQGRSPCLWNRLREPGRTFAFPDWRTPCRAIAGQPGREDHPGLVRAGRWPPRPRPNHPDPALRRNLFRPDSRPAIGHAHPEHPADAIPPDRSSAGQRID